MQQVNLLLNYLLEKLLMLMMAAIVVTVTWQVFSRFILQSPSSITEELARFLLIWIGLLGSAYAYKIKSHLGLDLFVSKLSLTRKRLVAALVEVCVIIFVLCVMVYGGISLVHLTLELQQVSAALGWQMGYVYLVIPISGVFILMFALANLRAIFTNNNQEQS